MAQWAVVVPARQYAAERLFANETVRLTTPGPAPGEAVLLVAAGERSLLFGLGVVNPAGTDVVYTHRLMDEPIANGVASFPGPGAYPVDPATFAAHADRIDSGRRVDAVKRTWLVSVDLPIEAVSAAEAVRTFWSYVFELGPRELPAFVSPSDDELAMRAFVLGARTDLDPEEGGDAAAGAAR